MCQAYRIEDLRRLRRVPVDAKIKRDLQRRSIYQANCTASKRCVVDMQ